MSQPHSPDDASEDSSRPTKPPAPMFSSRQPERTAVPVTAFAVAGLVVAVVFFVFLIAGHRRPPVALNVLQPVAAYASNLPLSQLAMSESTSLSGGKSTFIDGHIQNTGTQTVTGITVQVLFRNDEQMPPQVETLPLPLVRMREPYIDTEPVSASPIKPGSGQDFRLIFETIPANWNVQMPEIRVVQVTSK